ncbi:MauE/DoxX family redox-associated membrane protein [Mucilaginibacter sp. AW1-3]
MIKKLSLVILIIFYILSGINHFRNPAGYVHIIPTYLPAPGLLNILAGIFEITFGMMLMFAQTRPLAAWGIILMLLAFLPVHIDMIVHAPMMLGNFKITPLIAWLRIPLQGLLIWWAWWYTRT